MTAVDPNIVGGIAMRTQVVGDHSIGDKAAVLQKFAHQLQCGILVSL
jgi:hypothetical protein